MSRKQGDPQDFPQTLEEFEALPRTCGGVGLRSRHDPTGYVNRAGVAIMVGFVNGVLTQYDPFADDLEEAA